MGAQKHRTLAERCDFVIASCQHAKRSEKRGVSMAAAVRDAGGGGDGATGQQGADTVPKHFQSGLQAALTSMLYAVLKRGALQAVSRGGPGAHFAVRGHWHGLGRVPHDQAVQVGAPARANSRRTRAQSASRAHMDDELSSLGSIARVSWPELIGRAVGLQLTVDKVTLPENLQGLELPEMLAATSGSDWSALDLGACDRKARARLRTRDIAVAEKGKPTPRTRM